MDKKTVTNPYLSNVHASVFSKKIVAAQTPDALQAIAAEHGPWLLGDDKARLRDEYQQRLAQVGHRS